MSIGADGAAEFKAVHFRHLQVGDDQSARAVPQDLKCLAAVTGGYDVVTAGDQRIAQDRQGQPIVIDDQNAHFHVPWICGVREPAEIVVRAPLG